MHTTRHCLLTYKRLKIWLNLQEIKLYERSDFKIYRTGRPITMAYQFVGQ